MGSPYEISLLRCNCHMHSPGSVCVLKIFCPGEHASVRVPRRFRRCPFACSADSIQALEQPTASLADQYRANTGPVKPTSMAAIWTTRNSLQAQNQQKPISESSTCSSFTHGLYGPIWVQQSSKNCTNQQRGHPPSLIRVFAMRLTGKQGHKAASYEQRSRNKLSWVHMPFRFCHAHWLTYLSCYVFS